ncbi:MAG: hypothetical protein HQ582_15185 [Planctomycetes bacterium]|nr:hypothetical protein [Planctomycetota bacterium]
MNLGEEDRLSVSLRDVKAGTNQFAGVAALSFWFIALPFSIVGIFNGEWPLVLVLLLPVVILAIGELFVWLCRNDDVIAELYPTQMRLPQYRKTVYPDVVEWSQLKSIRWPRQRGDDAAVVLKLKNDDDTDVFTVPVRLSALSSADRLTLIRYLRRVGADVEQEHWPTFCQRTAVPLVESLEQYGPLTKRRTFEKNVAAWADDHAILAGLMAPLALPYVLVTVVSHATYWWLAFTLAVSALVNIRLVWGQWRLPFLFTEIVLAFSVGCALLGVAAWLARDRNAPAPRTTVILAWLGLFVILQPLCINLLAKAAWNGWKPPLARVVFYALVFGPFLLPLIWLKRQDAPLEPDAEQRWAAYESTGELPAKREDST